jgi:hypothetical protein
MSIPKDRIQDAIFVRQLCIVDDQDKVKLSVECNSKATKLQILAAGDRSIVDVGINEYDMPYMRVTGPTGAHAATLTARPEGGISIMVTDANGKVRLHVRPRDDGSYSVIAST